MENKEKKKIDFKTVFAMIWVFIKATVIPKYAYRFRNMYLFFPIILLIISWVLLPIPIQTYMKNNGRSEFRARNIYKVNTVYDLDDGEFSKIQDLKIRFELTLMYADDEEVDAKELVLTQGNNKLYVVIDLCEQDQVKKATVHYDYANFFDTYENDEGTNTLLVLYNSRYLLRTNKTSNYFEYRPDTIDVKEATLEEFANFLVDGMLASTINTYGWYATLYAVIVPLALCLFAYLVFKSSSRINQFRNYLNITGITSIVPTILVFSFSWIFPNLSLIQYYAPLYVAYFFFFVLVISFKKERIVVSE